jgi:hypothetical protein
MVGRIFMQIRLGEKDSELIEVYVQDFGDNYHKFNDEPSTELERTARKIRRRYKDISDYNRALLAYREYMSLLTLKHGGPELFALKLKHGQIDEFVPPMPGVKINDLNKFVMKNKIIVSKRRTMELDEEALSLLEDSYARAQDEDTNTDTVPRMYVEPKLSKDENKVVKRMIKSGEARSMARGRTSIRKNAPSIQYLEEYFYNKNEGDRGKKEEDPVFSLSQYYDGSFANMLKDTKNEERQTVFFRGNYIDQESADELAIYKQLGKVGWNSMKIMRDLGVSKRVTKAMKKGDKKDSKKDKKKRKSDNLVVQLMTDGGYDSFEDFQSEMESFKSSNVFTK